MSTVTILKHMELIENPADTCMAMTLWNTNAVVNYNDEVLYT